MSYILGINGGFGGGYQDPCACLYSDGKIIAAVEEERLNKVKFSTGYFPLLSIREVLDLAGISMQEVAQVAFHGISWGPQIETDVRNYFRHHFGHCPPLRRYHHHDAHAASSYFLSGFEEGLIITMDNSGDGVSSQVMAGKGGQLGLLKRWERPQSFGTFYSCITQLAGFRRDADEYKLMGLAPYGNPKAYDLSDVLQYTGNGDYRISEKYFYPIKAGLSYPNKQIPLYSDELMNLLGMSVPFAIKGTQVQKDLAASAQQHLEDVVCEWISYWVKQSGLKKLCLAGGVAMNCVLNKKILERCGIDELFIPPFAGDQGISIGVAFLAGLEQQIVPDHRSFSAYTGRNFSREEIESILKRDKISYRVLEDPYSKATTLLTEGKVIAWFRGPAEIGARALGNRSILALPGIPDIKDKVNRAIKFRESFRPFCPSVLEEDYPGYFNSTLNSIPYMNITADCREITKLELGGIVHADGTARVQTVSPEQNPDYHTLLSHVKNACGHGVLLNTSLNVREQPMAYDVNDALIAFFSSGLDALFLGDICLEKPA